MLFDDAANDPLSPSSSQGTLADGEDEEGIDDAVFHPTGNCAEDIALVRNQGLEVDDHNEPAPKNIPEENQAPITMNLYPGQTWGWDGIDQ